MLRPAPASEILPLIGGTGRALSRAFVAQALASDCFAFEREQLEAFGGFFRTEHYSECWFMATPGLASLPALRGLIRALRCELALRVLLEPGAPLIAHVRLDDTKGEHVAWLLGFVFHGESALAPDTGLWVFGADRP